MLKCKMLKCKIFALVLAVAAMVTLTSCSGKRWRSETVNMEWTIYEKNYVPGTPGASGRWGWSFSEDGGPVYISGTDGTPAMYELFLRRLDESGEVKTRTESVTQEEYATYEVGDRYTTKDVIWSWG